MMNSSNINSAELVSDQCNEQHLSMKSLINELYSADFQDPMIKFGNSLDENRGSIKSQSEIPQEMVTVSSLTPNSSASTLQTSAHIMSPIPNFVSNLASQSSESRRTTDFPQFTNQNQPLIQQVFEHIPQQPPTHPSMSQSTIMFGHQNNSIDQRIPSDQIQMRHLQNQQTMRQQHMVQPLQNFYQNQTHILIQEGGRHRVQGLVIGEGHRKPQEQRQGNISAVLSAPVGLKNPNEFPSNEMWREYAFRQISQLKEKYVSELLKIHRKAVHLCTQETNMEVAKKYENAKEFLEKIITFLNIPTVDMIPERKERVYNYMNFIVNYLTSFRNKNDSSSQNGPHLQPNGDMRF